MDYRIALSLQAKGKGKPQASSARDSPDDSEDSGLLTGRKSLRTSLTGSVQTLTCWQDNLHHHHLTSRTPVPPITRALRAALYGATVFLSFFLMLIFMTYNVRSHFTSAYVCHLMNTSIGLSHRCRGHWSVSWALYLWIYYQH